ncbi:MAG: tRNA pseudouridine(55) synthase TruB [Candidatus Sumerlaeia bacterium]
MMHGVIPVLKPKGPTSHDVVAKLRRLAHTKRIGHTGTLDPMAEGVLVCCIGKATRIVPWLTGLPKEYTGEMILGVSTNTYDAEGQVTKERDPSGISREEIEAAFHARTGLIEQIAPPYSAVKVKGKKLYEYARQGEEVPRKVRTVFVERFELLRFLPPTVFFRARVGSGTYIRSLAHTVGESLGCGAHLTRLVRTAVGSFEIDNALPLEVLEADPDNLLPVSLLGIEEALTFMPKLSLLPGPEMRLRHGGGFGMDDIAECPELPQAGKPVMVLDSAGRAIAICQSDNESGPWKPVRVFPADDAV